MFKKVMNIVIFALIFALYFVSFLMIFDSFRERKLASLEKNAIDVFDKEVKIDEKKPEENNVASTVSYSGLTIIGKLYIPKINFNSVLLSRKVCF